MRRYPAERGGRREGGRLDMLANHDVDALLKWLNVKNGLDPSRHRRRIRGHEGKGGQFIDDNNWIFRVLGMHFMSCSSVAQQHILERYLRTNLLSFFDHFIIKYFL